MTREQQEERMIASITGWVCAIEVGKAIDLCLECETRRRAEKDGR